MSYQIDQSRKIEQTNKDTVLAISNGRTFTVLLRARDKRLLQSIYRVSIEAFSLRIGNTSTRFSQLFFTI